MPVQVALPEDAHARNTEHNDSPAVVRRSPWLVNGSVGQEKQEQWSCIHTDITERQCEI